MDMVLRATFIYFFLMIVMRMAGHKTLAQMGPFDFVLLLIISEAVQQALLGEDFSATGAAVIILTLVGWAVVLDFLKNKSQRVSSLIDGNPCLLVKEGKFLEENMRNTRVNRDDIMEAARNSLGLRDTSQIDYAILETTGGISIIPKS